MGRKEERERQCDLGRFTQRIVLEACTWKREDGASGKRGQIGKGNETYAIALPVGRPMLVSEVGLPASKSV